MRGLSKPWPPSDVSPDGQTPRRFVDAEREYRTALPDRSDRTKFARTEFDRLDKGKLRKVMSGEQSSLCVYCERRLSENGEPAHVEHWHPLSGAPEHALHWRNLYLACATLDTCDGAKGNRRLRWDDADPDRIFRGPPSSITNGWSVSTATAGRTSATTCASTG